MILEARIIRILCAKDDDHQFWFLHYRRLQSWHFFEIWCKKRTKWRLVWSTEWCHCWHAHHKAAKSIPKENNSNKDFMHNVENLQNHKLNSLLSLIGSCRHGGERPRGRKPRPSKPESSSNGGRSPRRRSGKSRNSRLVSGFCCQRSRNGSSSLHRRPSPPSLHIINPSASLTTCKSASNSVL